MVRLLLSKNSQKFPKSLPDLKNMNNWYVWPFTSALQDEGKTFFRFKDEGKWLLKNQWQKQALFSKFIGMLNIFLRFYIIFEDQAESRI